MGNLTDKTTNQYGGGNVSGKKGGRVHMAKVKPSSFKKGKK